ncbi:hypothetical protein FBY28_3228 [Arthrobacter sp. SLBN-53]|nr:hypothetical protein FBY28_3228 [Arthrobacter sp. SLBN-53]
MFNRSASNYFRLSILVRSISASRSVSRSPKPIYSHHPRQCSVASITASPVLGTTPCRTPYACDSMHNTSRGYSMLNARGAQSGGRVGGHRGRTCGFNIPAGSKAARIRFMVSISFALRPSSIHAAFACPIPCSALILPR